ncbi:LysE family transporter [Ruegeria faecimaris]|uniref:LysE family transporter n=1 Tax=Ruegeria faecimaris TaxID=686389 RepID=UPI00249162BF|nr:LysE family transporter [Ruegeria faecimaris]
MSTEFLLTSLIVVLLPGTGAIYTLAVGLGRGFWASFAAAIGCTIGTVPAALASIVGLAALLHTSALAFLPQFIPAGTGAAEAELIKLALSFMAMTFVVFVGYGAFAAVARDYVIQRPTVMAWVRRCFAGAFGALGAKLALAD